MKHIKDWGDVSGRGNSQKKQGGQCVWNRESERERDINEVYRVWGG